LCRDEKHLIKSKGGIVAYQVVFKEGFLERAKRMSGLRTDSAFAGAIGISETSLNRAKKTGLASPSMIVGLYRAFGFLPGEVTTIADIPDSKMQGKQSLAA
jgi:hypothetical protein